MAMSARGETSKPQGGSICAWYRNIWGMMITMAAPRAATPAVIPRRIVIPQSRATAKPFSTTAAT